MADRHVARARRGLAHAWRGLSFEQRVAAVGALLLIVSTFGPFSFVEAAEVLVALAVLALLRARGQGRGFQLPFGDGVVIAAAGAWAGLLIAIRLFDRPLGLNLLALACAAILFVAGLSERAKRPPPELGTEAWEPGGDAPPPVRPSPPAAPDQAQTQPLAPPEFDPAGPASSAARRRGAAEDS